MNNTQNENEPTNEQRMGAVWRTLGSFRVAFGAIFFGAIAGLIWAPLLVPVGVGYYALMIYVAWRTGTSVVDKEKNK